MPSWLPRVRMILGFVGVATGVFGIARDDRRIVAAGIGVLATVAVLRVLSRIVSVRRDKASGGP